MCVIKRAQQGIFLVIAAELPDWALPNELAVECIAIFKAGRTHALGGEHAFCSFFGIGYNERTMFTAKKSSGVKGFQLCPLPQIESVADVSGRGPGGLSWPERARNARANVWRGDCLGRS